MYVHIKNEADRKTRLEFEYMYLTLRGEIVCLPRSDISTIFDITKINKNKKTEVKTS